MLIFTAKQMASYKTISSLSSGKYVEKGSRFLAFAVHVNSEKEVIDFLESIRKEHHKARHVCYAYTIGTTQEKYRINDDGEPSNTAGQPILNQIRKYGLKYIAVAVVRYFGGVLLGKGGLIHAYGIATSLAIEAGQIIEKTEMLSSQIKFHISHYVSVKDLIKKNKLLINFEHFDEEICNIEYLTEPESLEEIERLFLKYCI